MSTENNVTEEQIRSIVRDELQNETEQVADSIPFTRREILKGVSILGLGAAGAGLGTYGAVGQAAAQSSGSGNGTIGTADDPLEAIYVDQLYQNEDNINANSVNTERAVNTVTESRNYLGTERSRGRFYHRGRSIDPLDNLDGWTVESGTVTESSDARFGDQSLLFSAPSDGQAEISTTFNSARDFRNVSFSVGFRSEDNHFPEVRVHLRDARGGETQYVRWNESHDTVTKWHRMDLPQTWIGADLTRITSMSLIVKGSSDEATDAYIDDLRAIKQPDEDVGYIIFSFDDGYESVYQDAYPIMQEYGVKGAVSMPSDFIGSDGYLSEAQLREMSDSGWQINVHGKSHEDLTSISESEQITELRESQRWFLENGFRDSADILTLVGSKWDDTSHDLIPRWYRQAWVADGQYEAICPKIYSDPFNLPRIRSSWPDERDIAQRVAHTAQVGHFFWHEIGMDKSWEEISFEDFEALIQMVADHPKLEVVHTSDLRDLNESSGAFRPVEFDGGTSPSGSMGILEDFEVSDIRHLTRWGNLTGEDVTLGDGIVGDTALESTTSTNMMTAPAIYTERGVEYSVLTSTNQATDRSRLHICVQGDSNYRVEVRPDEYDDFNLAYQDEDGNNIELDSADITGNINTVYRMAIGATGDGRVYGKLYDAGDVIATVEGDEDSLDGGQLGLSAFSDGIKFDQITASAIDSP